MIRRFRGESLHKVDLKGRVSVPAPFRRVLEDGDPEFKTGSNPNFVIVYGGVKTPCLEAYTIKSISIVDQLISKLPRFSREREILERFINTQSLYIQLDENGRIVLPPKLKAFIGLEGEAIFAGMGEKFQIWEPKTYESELQLLQDDFSKLSGKANPFYLIDNIVEK
jgi:MraZ protein